jgi:hypothetical protein
MHSYLAQSPKFAPISILRTPTADADSGGNDVSFPEISYSAADIRRLSAPHHIPPSGAQGEFTVGRGTTADITHKRMATKAKCLVHDK